MDPAIDVGGLVRVFRRGRRSKEGEVRALDNLSLEVARGEVHGLLGPNGAGKTTLCKILSTVLLPTEGTVRVLGHDVVKSPGAVRPLIGIVFGGERGLYGRLSPRQNLLFWAALYRMPMPVARARTAALLERFGLGERADTPVETFSRGMKQRVHLARGILSDPPLILLDEPTTGMDPAAAHDFRRLVEELRSEGRTVLMATHDMSEAEEVCDRVTVIDGGRVLATETPRALITLASRHRWVEIETAACLSDRLSTVPGVVEVSRRADVIRIRTLGEESARAVLHSALDAGVTSVRLLPPRLEDVYLELVGARGMEV